MVPPNFPSALLSDSLIRQIFLSEPGSRAPTTVVVALDGAEFNPSFTQTPNQTVDALPRRV